MTRYIILGFVAGLLAGCDEGGGGNGSPSPSEPLSVEVPGEGRFNLAEGAGEWKTLPGGDAMTLRFAPNVSCGESASLADGEAVVQVTIGAALVGVGTVSLSDPALTVTVSSFRDSESDGRVRATIQLTEGSLQLTRVDEGSVEGVLDASGQGISDGVAAAGLFTASMCP